MRSPSCGLRPASLVAAIALSCLMRLGLASQAPAPTTWHVPSELPTIQAALDAAADGDTILVAPGTYPEALNTLSKTVTLRSTGGAPATVVDATGLGKSVIRITGGAPQIEGLTFTGGSPPDNDPRGGGVYVAAGTPTLTACIVRNNTVQGANSRGGGVYGKYPESLVTLRACTLSSNTLVHGSGGGASGQVVLFNCLVEGNTAATYGGGLSGVRSATGCVIRFNSAGYAGGGVSSSVDKFSHCVIQGNVAGNRGGGMYDVFLPDDDKAGPPLADVQLLQNTALTGDGGGLYYESGQGPLFEASLTRVIFADNTAGGAGDGAAIKGGALFFAHCIVDRCTFVNDGLYSPALPVSFNSSIMAPLSVDCSCVVLPAFQYSNTVGAGAQAGVGNIDADPLWVDPAHFDFGPKPGSPCIDAGDPSLPLDPDGTRADIGAVPFAAWSDLGGAVAGSTGKPVLAGAGTMLGGSHVTLMLAGAPALHPTALLVGFQSLGLPFKGGTLWPTLDLIAAGLPTDGAGSWTLGTTWPTGLPSGFSLWLQVWFADAGAPQGFGASNGLHATAP